MIETFCTDLCALFDVACHEHAFTVFFLKCIALTGIVLRGLKKDIYFCRKITNGKL